MAPFKCFCTLRDVLSGMRRYQLQYQCSEAMRSAQSLYIDTVHARCACCSPENTSSMMQCAYAPLLLTRCPSEIPFQAIILPHFRVHLDDLHTFTVFAMSCCSM